MNFIKLTLQSAFKTELIIKTLPQCRFFHSSQTLLFSQGGGKNAKGSMEIIRLYDQTGKVIGNKSKQEAETIAKKNGFTLVAMEILGKPKFPEYQLKPRRFEATSIDDDLDDEGGDSGDTRKPGNKLAKRNPKEIKRITFETSIGFGDLKVKIDQINNWISKDKEVHLTVVGTNSVSTETFYNQISEMFSKENRILINKQKGRNLRLIMDKKPNKGQTDSTEIPDNSDQSSSGHSEPKEDKFTIDPDLLSNEAELEKILKKNRKLK